MVHVILTYMISTLVLFISEVTYGVDVIIYFSSPELVYNRPYITFVHTNLRVC